MASLTCSLARPLPTRTGDRSGAAYVVFGGAGGFPASIALGSLNGSAGFRLTGVAAGDYAGWSVSGAGDVDGDGFADLLVGALNADPTGSNSGAAYVVFGGAGGFPASIALGSLNGSAGFAVNGAAADDRAGPAVSGTGDVNGDGFDDLLIGAYGADPTGSHSGAAYVMFGGAGVGSGGAIELSTLDSSAGFVMNGAAEYDFAGRAVSGAGDVNGDGFNDLLIGGAGVDLNGTSYGAAYVVFGARLNHPILPGAPGADTLRSTSAPQQLFGAQGADSLFGGFGDDLLDGGASDDLLTGDADDDLLRGGSGSDTYGFADGWGNDRVEEDQVRGSTTRATR